MWIIPVVCVVMWFLIYAAEKKKQQENVRATTKAKKFKVEPIHGTRKLATDRQMRKAGLM